MKRLNPEELWLVMATLVFILVAVVIMTYPVHALDTTSEAATLSQTDENATGEQFYYNAQKVAQIGSDCLGITDENEPIPWSSEKWIITAYCSCPVCVGKWSVYKGLTASGMTIQEGVTIACDPSIPFGTWIEIEGLGDRMCQDRGSAIIGNHIDLYFDSHEAACEWGLQERRVRIK